ncbi:hypothetical protein [Phenylobacterium sp.]|uniref:hypothetical protein n=1 Tax=Phenylobacterium sp. TaxID=1871053 RepID=UPI00121134FB|nr:hypothetical protein [Phenylobacterium sp.]THD62164.1 MAG: hypothetical protein E8A49_07790 [Phenylobacterium sp.]
MNQIAPKVSETDPVERETLYNLMNAPIRPYPYPHFYAQNVLPPGFYDEVQANIPRHEAMAPISEVRPVRGYKDRFVMQLGGPLEQLQGPQRTFWEGVGAWMLSGRLREHLLAKFRPLVAHRFSGVEGIAFYDEAMLVEDLTNYALGPHTDAMSKVITLLLYLPQDDSQARYGTSIYAPKDPARRCPGGPHYDRSEFDRVTTMPFTPNSAFGFVKSDDTWHGVEPVTEPDVRRWLLLYDIKVRRMPPAETA